MLLALRVTVTANHQSQAKGLATQAFNLALPDLLGELEELCQSLLGKRFSLASPEISDIKLTLSRLEGRRFT